ncbi:MAG: response regulator [Pseudobdellovibrionaceae bacterium]|jgi:signal transduction histidine kinase
MDKHKIICVDDEIDNLDALERLFRKKYTVLRADSAKQALIILDQNPDIALIITDQRMPVMTGVEFLEKTLVSHPDSTRILLTGYTDMESIIEAVNKGQIFRYLTKPWDSTDFLNTVDRGIERFVLQKELQLKNKELFLALDELKTLDKAKNNFMVLINHELRTPLTSILNFSELLAESKLNGEQKKLLDRVRSNTDRLKALIDDALLIVRAETGQLKIDKSRVHLGNIEDSLPTAIQNLLKQKEQKLASAHFAKPILADERLLKLVIHRLIHNAAKFGNNKSIIQVDELMIGQHTARISVYNQGPAIAPAVMQKILSPFFIDENVMNHSSGLGLGLTVCQAILKSHDSGLQIKNNDNGVSVYFDMPVG